MPFALTLLLLSQIYRWTDARGEVHYTDDASTIPRGAKVQTTDGEDVTVVPSPPPSTRAVTRRAEAGLRRPEPPVAQPGEVTVRITRYDVEVSDADREFIERSVREAAASPRLQTWGGLRRSVTGTVSPASFMKIGEAFGLAAGTQFWLIGPGELRHHSGRAMKYPEAALHELGHLVEDQWARSHRPRWFAEGFACYVADTPMAATIDDIAAWVYTEGGATPLDRAFQPDGKCSVYLAYAIAHEALKFLVSLVGEPGIRQIFEARARGAPFDAAFLQVAHVSVSDFQRRFVDSLRPHYYERSK